MNGEITVPRSTVRLWRLRTAAAAGFIALPLFRLLSLTLWMLLPAGIIVLAAAVLMFWYIPRRFSSYLIRVNRQCITVYRGFIIKAEYILPQPRMIYAGTYTSPLARKYRLSGVTLRAARGMLVLPELSKKDAEKILAAASGDRQ